MSSKAYKEKKFNNDLYETMTDSGLMELVSNHIKNEIVFYSASDLAIKYGGTRQIWDKRMITGKLWFQQTSSGKITTDKHVEEFLKKKNLTNNRSNYI